MTKKEALAFVKSMLDIKKHEHIKAAVQIPRLKENTTDAVNKIHECYEALGIDYK